MSLPVYDSCVMKGFGQCQIEVRFPWKARTRYFWKVMMTTPEDGRVESESAWFETAKQGGAWEAKFISVPEDKERMPVLYRDFIVQNKPEKARLYLFISSHTHRQSRIFLYTSLRLTVC